MTRWPSRMALAAVLCASLALLLQAAPAHADDVTQYQLVNDQLEQLVEEREAAESNLASSQAIEQSALERFNAAESELHALLGTQVELTAEQETAAGQLQQAQAAVNADDGDRARMQKRIDAQEAWLFGTDRPRVWSMRGYERALSDLEALDERQNEDRESLAQAQKSQDSIGAQLAKANADLARWRDQAQALSGQVGLARSRSLDIASYLQDLQKQGDELAAQVEQQFQALRLAGHPVGVAKIASGPIPIDAPADWPNKPVPSYALPVGATAAALIASDPLQATADALAQSGALDGIDSWQAPVTGQITTPFGDATPYQPAHWAIDIGTRLYTPVAAAAEGVVEFAGLSTGNPLASYGLAVMIRHNEHVTTLYAHLDDRAYGLAVQAGDRVQKGQIVGYVGLTGYTTGPHLHFEARDDNRPFDPLLVVQP